ncbi:MAG: malate dehydrogenase [Deltaproteobacteria bacterium]
MKISVIGAGNVGGLTAMRIAQDNLGEVALIDIAPGMAKGKAFDMMDAAPLTGVPYEISGSQDIADVKGSGVVVVTAGLARKPGMTREDLLARNSEILKGICASIRSGAEQAVVIIVTNPLDVMTWLACRELGSTGKVFGMGVTLDAARFSACIADELNIPSTSVKGCVIGSHGEGMLPLPRFTMVNGKPLTETVRDQSRIDSLCKRTVERGKEIVSLLGSGSAYFAPSAAIWQIVRAVVKDEKAQLAASVYLKGQYGVNDVCLGTPCVIGKAGIEKIIELPLDEGEKKAFCASADSVKKMCALLHS